jgi:hypothetical protein
MKLFKYLILVIITASVIFLFKPSGKTVDIRYCGHTEGLRYSSDGYRKNCGCTGHDETFLDDGSKLGEFVYFYCVKNKSLPVKLFADISLFPNRSIRNCISTVMPATHAEITKMQTDCRCTKTGEIILYDSSYVGKPVNLYCVNREILPKENQNLTF